MSVFSERQSDLVSRQALSLNHSSLMILSKLLNISLPHFLRYKVEGTCVTESIDSVQVNIQNSVSFLASAVKNLFNNY